MRPVLEVADIFRRHGDVFRADKAAASRRPSAASWPPSRRAAPPCSAGMSSNARTAARSASPTIPAAIDTAPSARAWSAPNGWPTAAPNSCQSRISTSSSPCRPRSPPSPCEAVVYDILFKAAAETVRTIGADPKHLGAETGMIAILHSWGQTLTHHPHVHCIVPGGGLAPHGRGSPAAPASSCRSMSSRGSTAASSSNACSMLRRWPVELLRHARLSEPYLTESSSAFSATLTTTALDRRSLRWFGACP